MKKDVITFLLISLFVGLNYHTTFAQQIDNAEIYREAFTEQLKMLKGEIPISYKRAVFITENAYHNGKLDYLSFCNDISVTAQQLKSLIRKRGLEKFKTSGNWAVFTFMNDSLPINNFHPCTYDFNDFMGNKDWTKMFVTKLIKTKRGNCHSLPSYYKILCEEIGAKAYLALAPNHLYIKHIDEKGQWTNVELTNGGFPRDQWIIKEMAISVEAIKNEVYMNPLSDKESIALCMFDLANAYQYQNGYDSFVFEIADSALTYFPKCIPLIQTKANCLRELALKENNKPKPNKELLQNYYLAYQDSISKIDELGYQDESTDHYEDWVKMVEKEKRKRELTTNTK